MSEQTEQNFIQVSAEVLRKLRQINVTATQYALLFYLLDSAQSGQWVDLNTEAIAADLGVCARTVARGLQRLEDLQIFDTELVSAHYKIRINSTLFFSGHRDPFVGQTDPSVGQTDPFVGQTDPFVGQTDPFVPVTKRKNEGSRRSPQTAIVETLERDLSLSLNQDRSLSEGESEREILAFIQSRNPQAKNPIAYSRAAWRNDRPYWLSEYREWKRSGEDNTPSPYQLPPIASVDFIQQQYTGLCTAAAAAGDRLRISMLMSQLKRDYPSVFEAIGKAHPDWLIAASAWG